MDPRTFRNALGHFATGITVVTAKTSDGEPVGVTVNAFSSVSLDPPLVLVCLGTNTADIEAFTSPDSPFNINVLRDDQAEISTLFAKRDREKFDTTPWSEASNGVPRIDGCLAHLECRLASVQDGGDHLILIGRVEETAYDSAGQPLLYFRGAYEKLA
ncbi:flavin reductase family protein [Magnetospira sp. QH-2]|uniref:flavin reductase family protein n=1 Tax=Magnetospira sp. (strain QH-2) TaxID=1288970 RepID=UPI0003E815A4|nr:flavin reductase family protein [Magnetospira sp. QH-2]CCQ73855.1 Putative flavin:NADH oxidoreductase subunit of alternative pyrimidine degradation pathway [Magnetospira sp. QH-2]